MLDSSTSIQWLAADILTTLVFLPSLGALVLLFLSNEAKNAIRTVGLLASGATLAVSVMILVRFNSGVAGLEAFRPLLVDPPWMPRFGLRYLLGVDGISVVRVLLPRLLPLCVLVFSFGQTIPKLRGYVAAFLVLETGMVGSLVALDAVLFYVFWEVMLIPMYFIIGVWGGKRRIYATMKFVLFTLAGSLLMFLAILFTAGVHSKVTGIQTFSVLDWV